MCQILLCLYEKVGVSVRVGFSKVMEFWKEVISVREGIHPDYKETVIKCACGNVIETGSTKENISIEICSNCHPFYTGKQKLVDTGGRVDKFRKRYGLAEK